MTEMMDMAPVADVTVTAGSGDPFEAFFPGATIELVEGFQGGWHFEIRVHITPEAIDTATTELEIHGRLKASGEEIATIYLEPGPSFWVPDADGWTATIPPMVTPAFEYPSEWIGQDVVFDLLLSHGQAQSAETTVELLLVDDV